MKGMLAPKFRDVEQGRVEVRQVYKISNVGMVAGSYVLSGKVTRGSQVRVVRDGIIIADDKIADFFYTEPAENGQVYKSPFTKSYVELADERAAAAAAEKE